MDARRAIVNMGGTKAVAAVLMKHSSEAGELCENVIVDALDLLSPACALTHH